MSAASAAGQEGIQQVAGVSQQQPQRRFASTQSATLGGHSTSHSRVGSTRGTSRGWLDVQISVVEKMLNQETEQLNLMERARVTMGKGSVSESKIAKQKQQVQSLQAQYAQLTDQFHRRRTSVFRYTEEQQNALHMAISTGNAALVSFDDSQINTSTTRKGTTAARRAAAMSMIVPSSTDTSFSSTPSDRLGHDASYSHGTNGHSLAATAAAAAAASATLSPSASSYTAATKNADGSSVSSSPLIASSGVTPIQKKGENEKDTKKPLETSGSVSKIKAISMADLSALVINEIDEEIEIDAERERLRHRILYGESSSKANGSVDDTRTTFGTRSNRELFPSKGQSDSIPSSAASPSTADSSTSSGNSPRSPMRRSISAKNVREGKIVGDSTRSQLGSLNKVDSDEDLDDEQIDAILKAAGAEPDGNARFSMNLSPQEAIINPSAIERVVYGRELHEEEPGHSTITADIPHQQQGTLKLPETPLSAAISMDADHDVIDGGSSLKSEIVFKDGQVMAGSLDGLLAHLVPTPDVRPDQKYIMAFLFTYRIFISPRQLLDKISEHYMALLDAVLDSYYLEGQIRTTRIMLLRYLILFRIWLQQFNRDFRDRMVSIKMLRMIEATEMLHVAHQVPFATLVEKIARINIENPQHGSESSPLPSMAASLNLSKDSEAPTAGGQSPRFSGRNILVQQLKNSSKASITPPGTPPTARAGKLSNDLKKNTEPITPVGSGTELSMIDSPVDKIIHQPITTEPLFNEAEKETISELTNEIKKMLNVSLLASSRDPVESFTSQVLHHNVPGTSLAQPQSHPVQSQPSNSAMFQRRNSVQIVQVTSSSKISAKHNVITISKSVEKIARNLIWKDYCLFVAIQPEEYVLHLQKGSDLPQTADHQLIMTNLNAYVSWFNALSYWVATQVCGCSSLTDRAAAIEKLVKIARYCEKSREYNVLMAILSGLNNSSVQRLKKTWHVVKNKIKAEFYDLEETMKPQSNFRHYRELLEKQAKKNLEKFYHKSAAASSSGSGGSSSGSSSGTMKRKPGLSASYDNLSQIANPKEIVSDGSSTHFFVPFFTLDIKDLYVIHDANPNVLVNGLINFDKMRTIAERVTRIVSFKRAAPPNSIQPDFVKMQPFLNHLEYLNDNDLYRQSCIHEPRDLSMTMTSGSQVIGTSKLVKEKKLDEFESSTGSETRSMEMRKTISEPNLAALSKSEKKKK